MRRLLAPFLIAVALLVAAPVFVGAASAQEDTTTTTMAGLPVTPTEDGTTTTTTVVAEPADELANTGPRDTMATLAVGFLLLGLGMVSMGAARRLLVAERYRH